MPSRGGPGLPILISGSWWALPVCIDLVMAGVVCLVSTAVAYSLLVCFSVEDTSSLVLPMSGTGVIRTLTHDPIPKVLCSQCAWGSFALSLGVSAVGVVLSWAGVIGSPRADLGGEEAVSVV